MLKDVGVHRILHVDVDPTIKHFNLLAGSDITFYKIGSTGKGHDNGDIDLAVDANVVDMVNFHQHMISQLGQDNCKLNKGLRIGSYAVDICGDIMRGKVQVDIMFVDDIVWAQFAYYSPPEGDSQYKGAIRNILLSSVTNVYRHFGLDWSYEVADVILESQDSNDMQKNVVALAARTFDLNRGFRRIFKIRPKNKKTGKYLSSLKTVEWDEFVGVCPNTVLDRKIVVTNPTSFVRLVFHDPLLQHTHCLTTEQVLNCIKKFDKPTQNKIFKIAAIRAEDVVHKMKIPPEILNVMNQSNK